jgi:hypothetical protein
MSITEPVPNCLLESRQTNQSEAMLHAEYSTEPGPEVGTKE